MQNDRNNFHDFNEGRFISTISNKMMVKKMLTIVTTISWVRMVMRVKHYRTMKLKKEGTKAASVYPYSNSLNCNNLKNLMV
jgi:hypothetical protein